MSDPGMDIHQPLTKRQHFGLSGILPLGHAA